MHLERAPATAEVCTACSAQLAFPARCEMQDKNVPEHEKEQSKKSALKPVMDYIYDAD